MRFLKATHTGKIDLGMGVSVPCYVLDDAKHTRVLSQRGFEGAAGIPHKDRSLIRAADKIEKNYGGSNLYAQSFRQPIEFRVPSGSIAHGFNATAVADFCGLIIEAHFAGGLSPAHEEIARHCARLQAAYAQIGIIALVDEATGYQSERENDELQKLLKLYISDELMPWTARFPAQFFKHMFRLRGWSWGTGQQGPRYAGKLVNWVVYDRMPPCVLDELRRRNPAKAGRRDHHHHQHLTENHGVRELEHRITQAVTLMEVAKDWSMFARLLDRVSPPYGGQLLLSIPEEINAEPS